MILQIHDFIFCTDTKYCPTLASCMNKSGFCLDFIDFYELEFQAPNELPDLSPLCVASIV